MLKLSEIYSEEFKKLVVEKEEKKKNDEIIHEHPIYGRLKNKLIDLAQVANMVSGYSAKDATSRSLFNKKANRETHDGYKDGFTRGEIKQIESALTTLE